MANASDSDSEDWRFDPSRADQKRASRLTRSFFTAKIRYFYINFCNQTFNYKKAALLCGLFMVDAKGVEPSTSAMRMQHSPN